MTKTEEWPTRWENWSLQKYQTSAAAQSHLTLSDSYTGSIRLFHPIYYISLLARAAEPILQVIPPKEAFYVLRVNNTLKKNKL